MWAYPDYALIIAAVLDIVFLLRQVNKAAGASYVAFDFTVVYPLARVCPGIPSKVTDKLLNLTSQSQEGSKVPSGLHGLWRQHIPHLGILAQPVYWIIWKATSFDWGREQLRPCGGCSL